MKKKNGGYLNKIVAHITKFPPTLLQKVICSIIAKYIYISCDKSLLKYFEILTMKLLPCACENIYLIYLLSVHCDIWSKEIILSKCILREVH